MIDDFSKVYVRNYSWMLNEAMKWNKQSAEDIVHDTFTQFLSRSKVDHLLEMSNEHCIMYLRKCIHSQINKHWRKASALKRGGGVFFEGYSLDDIDYELHQQACHRYQIEARSVGPITTDQISQAVEKLKQTTKPSLWKKLEPYFSFDDQGFIQMSEDKRSPALRTALCRARSKLRIILKSICERNQKIWSGRVMHVSQLSE